MEEFAQTMPLDTHHQDFVHDVSYDFYGTRMATCSSDQRVRVWDKNTSGIWQLTYEWKAHLGSVWKVDWAHPQFGQILATCSFDHSAIVWEEVVEGGKKNMAQSTRIWKKRTRLVDSKASVSDVKFAPHHFGLKLATCDAEGLVRVYEAMDVMNLAQWTMQEEIPTRLQKCTAVSWSTSQFDPQMLVVSGYPPMENPTEPPVKIFQYSESSRRWQLLVSLMGQTSIPSAPSLASDPARHVNDVAWAPNLGRTYHLIACACADGNVYLWRVSVSDKERPDITLLPPLTDHRKAVWSVKWNVTGTVLASSGDDGAIRTWKRRPNGEWASASKLSPTSQ